MDYVKLINRFWEQYREAYERPTASEVTLYFLLLDHFQRNKWPEELEISTTILMNETGYGINRFTNTRQNLVFFGLIEYKKCIGKGMPKYKINVNPNLGLSKTDSPNVNPNLGLSKTDSQNVNPNLGLSKTDSQNVNPNDLSQSPHTPLIYYDNINDNIKNNPPPQSACAHDASACAKEGYPTLEEAKTKASMTGIPEEDAQAWWEHYQMTGWTLGSGVKMSPQGWEYSMKKWHNENQTERDRKMHAGPKVNETPGRRGGNEKVSTQTEESLQITCKNSIVQWIGAQQDKARAKQIATRAYRLKGSYDGAWQLLLYAYRDGNADVRRMIEETA